VGSAVSDDAEQHGMPADVPADPAADPGADAHVGRPQTGHPEVDEVLASLDGLTQLPLAAQVAVLERAHERLRGALDGAVDADVPGHGA
jgi:hypothetical protein